MPPVWPKNQFFWGDFGLDKTPAPHQLPKQILYKLPEKVSSMFCCVVHLSEENISSFVALKICCFRCLLGGWPPPTNRKVKLKNKHRVALFVDARRNTKIHVHIVGTQIHIHIIETQIHKYKNTHTYCRNTNTQIQNTHTYCRNTNT